MKRIRIGRAGRPAATSRAPRRRCRTRELIVTRLLLAAVRVADARASSSGTRHRVDSLGRSLTATVALGSTSGCALPARPSPGARPGRGARLAARQLLERITSPAPPTCERPVMPRGVLLVERLLLEAGESPPLRARRAGAVCGRGDRDATLRPLERGDHRWREAGRSRRGRRGQGTRDQRAAGRARDGDRADGGDAPLEVPGAADLRLRPALVGRLRDRGGAGRARRGLGRRRATCVPGLDRDRRAARDRRALVPPDGARLPERGRRVHRREGEPRQAPEPRRGGSAADRLHPHRRGLGRRRRARAHVCGDEPAGPRARRCRSAASRDHDRQPARRSRGGDPLRDPDLRVRRRRSSPDRRRLRALRRGLRARRPSSRIRCWPARAR